MNATDPTALGRWLAALSRVLPEPTRLPFRNVHLLGPFENAGYQGWLASYPPEEELDLTAAYQGKSVEVSWQPAPDLEGVMAQAADLAQWTKAEPWSVLYLYAELEAVAPQIAQLSCGSPGMVRVWANGQLTLSPMIPRPAHRLDDRILIHLKPGSNQLLIKLHFGIEPWQWQWRCDSYGDPQSMEAAVQEMISQSSNELQRLLARYTLVEIQAVQGDVPATHQALKELREDPFATRWDQTWGEMAAYIHQETGSFLPLHDVPIFYEPVTGIEAHIVQR